MVNFDYFYNPDAVKKIFQENHLVDRKLGFQVIENGTVLPGKDLRGDGRWSWGGGGIVDSNGKYIENSHVYFGIGTSYTPPRIN